MRQLFREQIVAETIPRDVIALVNSIKDLLAYYDYSEQKKKFAHSVMDELLVWTFNMQ